jgi:hypothetical protein
MSNRMARHLRRNAMNVFTSTERAVYAPGWTLGSSGRTSIRRSGQSFVSRMTPGCVADAAGSMLPTVAPFAPGAACQRARGRTSFRARDTEEPPHHGVRRRWPHQGVFSNILKCAISLRDNVFGVAAELPAPAALTACRLCGKPLSHSTLWVLRQRAATPDTYVHRSCLKAERLQRVPCYECGNTIELPPHRVQQLKDRIEVGGRVYRYCGTCSRRKRADPIRLFASIILDDALIERYRAGKPAAVREVNSRLRDHLKAITPKRWNKADVPKQCRRCGRQLVGGRCSDCRTPKGYRRRKAAFTWIPRPKLSVANVVAAKLSPWFRPCPVCHLLVYWADRTRPLTAFHPECAKLFKKSNAWRAWKGRRIQNGRLGIRTDDDPFPWPSVKPRARGRPRGPSVDPAMLLTRYIWLVRRAAPQTLGGHSLARLAAKRSDALFARTRSKSAISQGISAFVGLLPGSWSRVFRYKGQRATAKILSDLFPLPAHRQDRAELIAELGAKGMPPEDIAGLVGEPLYRVRQIVVAGEAPRQTEPPSP